MKKLMFLSLFCLSAISFAGESWKNDKYLWEKLFDNRDNIESVVAGDINGDMKDDIAVIYNEESDERMKVAVTIGKEYKIVDMDKWIYKYIGTDKFKKFKAVEIRDGKIYVKSELNVNEFIKDMDGDRTKDGDIVASRYADRDVLAVFEYKNNKIQISDISGSAVLRDSEATAQYFYNVKDGYIYYNYLQKPEKIGEANSYYYKNYSRVIASKISEVEINCDEDKWVLKSNANKIDSSWKRLEVTYGFEKWKNDFDLSAKYYIGYDERNLYILAKVADDVFRQNLSGDKGLRGDHIELWFGDNYSNKYQLALLPGNFGNIKPEIMQWYNKNKPVSNKKISGAEIKSKKTDNGYIIEAKIPFSEFGEPNLFNLTKFTFSVSDSDEADKQEKLLASSSLTWGDNWSIGEIIWE